MTDDVDLEDVVACPHCEGVLSGPWEEHLEFCPVGGLAHNCRDCDAAVDQFAIRRL